MAVLTTPRNRDPLGIDDRLRMVRLLAAVGLVACALSSAWIALPHAPRAQAQPMLAIVVAGLVCITLLLRARRPPDRLIKAVLAAVTALISAGIVFAGAPDTGLELVYVWGTPYAYFFFSGRHAALQTFWVAIGYAAALAGQELLSGAGPAEELPGRWLMLVRTVTAVGLLVRQLARWTYERDSRLRRAFEDSPFGMALVGTDLRFLEVNDAICAIHGRTREELLQLTIGDVSHPADRAISQSCARTACGWCSTTSGPVTRR